MADAAPPLRECERWFIRRGVPHLMADYDAGEDIWTRSLPILVLLYVVRGLYALDVNERVVFNLFALLLVAGVLVATWVIANVVRRRPAFALPRQVGPTELAIFVIGPLIPPLLLGQWADAAKAALLGLLALLVVYVATSYGLVPMLRWAGERSLALAASLGTVLTRALPLLLVVITFLFFTGEVWQTIGTLSTLLYLLVLSLFFVIGGGFVLTGLPGDVRAAGTLDSWDEVRDLTAGTPAEAITLPSVGVPPPPDLSRRQYVNVALVGLFARTIQIAVVAVAVGAFLALLGTLAIDEATTASWTGGSPDVIASWTLAGRELVVTSALLRVAGFLAVFAGLTFTVHLITDPTYRQEFRTDMASEVREVFAVRAAYLVARASQA